LEDFMRRKASTVVAGLLLFVGRPAVGQQMSSRFTPWKPSGMVWTRETAPALSGDYRYKGRQLPTVSDSIRRIAGYQHWRGAGLGLAIGAGFGTLFGLVVPLECDDCQVRSRGHMWTAGLVGAGTGAVVGFLAGLASPKYVWVPTDRPVGSQQ
jgi:hypothetical protein